MATLSTLPSFLLFLLENFIKDRCQRSAAALSYTTLLSLVPLTAVVFSILAAFPVFQSFAEQIQDFIFKNFVPASGEVVRSYLEEFATKASRLTAIGIGFLILSALLMMNTIETALNDIWHVRQPRKALPKFMVYWATLTLGPILVGASLAITSYLTSLPLINDTLLLSGLKSTLLGLLPFFATTLACTLLYAIVPNTIVPLKHAFTGALVAAILFELAKKGFAFYVTTFPTYEMVYGTLATIPVFLVWVYLSWLVVLLGAEITFCLTHFQAHLEQQSGESSFVEKFLIDFHVLRKTWLRQQQGELATLEELTEEDPYYDEAALTESVERLQQHQLLHTTCDHRWALTKAAESLTFADLFKAQGHEIPLVVHASTTPPRLPPGATGILEKLEQTSRASRAGLDQPLLPLLQQKENNEKPD